MRKLVVKNLIQRIKSKGGRSRGVITAPRRGNLIIRKYRFVDFKRMVFPGKLATIVRLEKDPNRNSLIAMTVYPDCCLNYIIAHEGSRIGQKIGNEMSRRNRHGDSKKLKEIGEGNLIYNLSPCYGNYGQYIRSAGATAILVKTKGMVSLIKMKSGEYRYFFSKTNGVLGKVSNSEYFLEEKKKAGKMRRLGIRPRNRPFARNPVDHPMGGRTKGGTAKKTPKGKICLKTETKKVKNKMVIIKKREKKKL